MHATTCVVGKDPPRIGERAATRGRIVAVEGGDAQAGVQVPWVQRAIPRRGNRALPVRRPRWPIRGQSGVGQHVGLVISVNAGRQDENHVVRLKPRAGVQVTGLIILISQVADDILIKDNTSGDAPGPVPAANSLLPGAGRV